VNYSFSNQEFQKYFLKKPATINDGILKISNQEFQEYAKFFDEKRKI
jgi:hypothetical protein